jgi:hypothetical protein
MSSRSISDLATLNKIYQGNVTQEDLEFLLDLPKTRNKALAYFGKNLDNLPLEELTDLCIESSPLTPEEKDSWFHGKATEKLNKLVSDYLSKLRS